MSSAAARKPRPKYLSLRALLLEIRLPLPGWVSILHRVSGALLVFPFAAWLLFMLDASLQSEDGFARVQHYLRLLPVKLGVLLFVWAYCHHFCAGIRFLLLDLNKGIALAQARRSSYIVLIVSIALTAWFGAKLW
jgi:succinate dehydrogenase / fumarate reductase, cytochrome b subunit